MRNLIKRHWRLLLPLTVSTLIICLNYRILSLPYPDLILTTLVILLGAAWYYYFRTLGSFTPGFTAFGSLLLVLTVSFLDPQLDFCNIHLQMFTYALTGLIGIVIFAVIYYATRTKAQRQARQKQVAKIWRANDKLIKKLSKKKKR